MRVFMLVSRIPWPLEKGDKLRAYHQLKCLATEHEVHLFCLSDTTVDGEALNQLRQITPHVTVLRLNPILQAFRLFLALFSSKPFQVHYFYQYHLARKIFRAIEEIKPDRIYCQLVRCAEYVKHLHAYPRTLDYMDALSIGQQRRISGAPFYLKPWVREEARRLRGYEHLIFDYFDHHTIISEQDRQLIYHPDCGKIQVVPNGIDAAYFAPSSTSAKVYDVVFTGNMSYPPNVEGALFLFNKILPLASAGDRPVRLLIAGATPVAALRALESEHIHVSGWLADIREAYLSSKVFLAPMLSGSGMQNKLLEAMAMELPCITTSLAANAIGAQHGQELYIADTEELMVKYLIELLENPQKRRDMGIAARNFVQTRFQWDATVKELTASWQKA